MSKVKKQSTIKFFQRLARAFLVPLAVISVGSLLLVIGSLFEQSFIVSLCPALFTNKLFAYIFVTIPVNAGMIILRNMGLIYAVALAFSLAKEEKEYAAFGATIGYLAFLKSMEILVTSWPEIGEMFPQNGITQVLGMNTVNCGILGGMITGLVCYLLHKKFKDIKLPLAFSFFQGIRFVPIICLITMTLFGQVFPFVWVYISNGIAILAKGINSLGIFGPFAFAVVERALIPTGLHQIWNALIRTTAVSGQYVFASGATATGVVEAYAHYLKEGMPIVPEGITLKEMVKYCNSPQIPMMLGGLPAIALALYHCADKDKKDVIKPLALTGVMCSVFAAVSEPIEFIFLFIAPGLYALYSVLTGLSWLLCYVLGSTMGGGESSLFGFIVFGILRPDSKWWIMAGVTVFEAIACYFLTRWYIIHFDVKTPGRGGEYDDSLAFAQEIANVKSKSDNNANNIDTSNPEQVKASVIIEGLGGADNIEEVDSCMTRLRVNVHDLSKINEEILRKTGSSGIVYPGENEIQIVYGPAVTMIKKTIKKMVGK